MSAFRFVFRALLAFLLTVLTQTGGLIYLLTRPFVRRQRRWRRVLWYLGVYAVVNIVLVPPLARQFGRVPLPIFSEQTLRPLNYGFVLLNRHYVQPELHELSLDVAREMDRRFPRTVTAYLDANFPFFDGFPLLPHLSHDDGRKLDLAFYYEYAPRSAPTLIGYGSYEEARRDEKFITPICYAEGSWWYGLIGRIYRKSLRRDLRLDTARTSTMIELLARDRRTGKLFLEPHLKTRWRLNYGKVRFQGCHAVRHDDHVHVQL